MFDPNSAANKLASRIQRRLLALAPSETKKFPSPESTAADEGRNQRVEKRLLDFEATAAVSGRFDPTTCFQTDDDQELRQAVLNRAVTQHNVETVDGEVRWILNPDLRRTMLTRLSKDGKLHPLLAGELPDTDAYGVALRQLLEQGADVTYESLTPANLLHIKAAAEELAGTGLPLPEIEPIRRQLVNDAFEREYLPVPEYFVGRRRELDRLHEFLEHPRDPSRWLPWSALVLTGLGGAGKSALLAQFMHEVYERKKATIVVLDFDRPGIDPNDLVWLRLEIAKQVGLQYPDVEPQLRESRREARNVQVSSGERAYGDGFENVNIMRSSDDLLYQVSSALQSIQAITKPLLMVFDTLEVISGADYQQALLKWIDVVGEILSATPIKVIFSGRLFDSSVEAFRERAHGAVTTLDALPKNTATLLLRRSGVPARLAKALSNSDWLPRRPLELRLMARLALQGGLTSENLERDLRAGNKAELTAALIYRRVLLRIDDLLIRQLASPGLILRFVTPAILREVLAPALNLPDMTIDEAQQALNKLAAHTWLVTRDARGVLWHRRDLRRSILKLMVAENPKAAEQISQQAIAHFQESSTEDQVEATYHRLMLVRQPEEGAELELGRIKEAYDAISADIDDLPPPAAALVRYAAQKSLTAEEMELLPARYFRRAYDKTGRRLVKAREFGQAYRLLRRLRSQFPSEANPGELTEWEVDTLYATAHWDELAGVDHIGNRPLAHMKAFSIDVLLGTAIQERAVPDPSSSEVENLVHEVATSSGDGAGPLSYFVIAMSILNQRDRLGANVRAAIPMALETYGRAENKPTSAMLQHRLLLLSLLGDSPVYDKLQLAPSLLKLQPESLKTLAQVSTSKSLGELVSGAAAVFQKGNQRRTVTAKNIMSAVDALYKHASVWHNSRLPINDRSDPRVVALLRGPDPEFRDPIRFCILEEYTDDRARRRLAELIQSVIDVPLDDLRPEPFADQLALAPEHSLSAYVEFVDRSWRTGRFLEALCHDRPSSSRLEQVRAAHSRWDCAIESLLATKFDNSLF